jgi:hypothetical protein
MTQEPEEREHAQAPAEGNREADPADNREHPQDPAEGADAPETYTESSEATETPNGG